MVQLNLPGEWECAVPEDAGLRREGLPAEFAETIRTGWWTTCLENLPARERARGKY